MLIVSNLNKLIPVTPKIFKQLALASINTLIIDESNTNYLIPPVGINSIHIFLRIPSRNYFSMSNIQYRSSNTPISNITSKINQELHYINKRYKEIEGIIVSFASNSCAIGLSYLPII